MSIKIPKKIHPLILALSIFLGIGLLCFATYKILESPRYIVLSIPMPPPQPADSSRWDQVNYVVTDYEEGSYSARHFVWQRYGIISRKSGLDTWEAIIEYFDSWISKDGWIRFQGLEYFDPCAFYWALPYFSPQENGFAVSVYRKANTVVYRDEPTVCLLVWPTESHQETYEVILMTINPSLLTRWNSTVDFFGVPTMPPD